jgi:hypothetical protein
MPDAEADLSLVVVHLAKGVIYRDIHPVPWRHLARLQAQVRDYVATLGLRVVIDEAEGYAFLRSLPDLDDREGQPLPRLIARRPLSFHVSLLLALLRKRLAEFDASSGDVRLILSREQIVEMVRVFLPATTNEVRLFDQIDTHIGKVVDLGYLRRIPGQEHNFEVRRILKAFVDGQWLGEFEQRLAEYAAELTDGGTGTQG